jgi:spermidine synthase
VVELPIRWARAWAKWWFGGDTLSPENAARAVFLAALATGFTGLAYEAVWHRYLSALLGSNARAAALLTGGFLAAMSLGCWWAGRLTRRDPAGAVRAYGWIETALGVWALAFPLLFAAGASMPAGFFGLGIGADLILTGILIAPPAALMGATIPVLTHILAVDARGVGRKHALLYGVNTLGAFLGVVVAGFYLIDLFGLRGTLWLLAPVNLAVGSVFLNWSELAPDWKPPRRAPDAAPSETSRGSEGLLLAAAALSSFSFLALENWVLRLVGIAGEGSALSFAVVIGAFVIGTGVGALAAAVRGRSDPNPLPWLLAVSCAAWLAVYATVDHWPYWAYALDFRAAHGGASPFSFQLYRLAALSLLLLPAVAPVGAFLPICFSAVKRGRGAGEASGAVYAASAMGLALGAVIGGYWILGWTGLAGGFRFALGIQLGALLLTLAALRSAVPRAYLAGAAATALVLVTGALATAPLDEKALSLSFYHLNLPEKELPPEADAREKLLRAYGMDRVSAFGTGREASVAVLERTNPDDPAKVLTINGRSNGTTEPGDRAANELAALIPYLLAKQTERSLLVGFGTGITAGTLASMEGVQRVDVLEISGQVIRFGPEFDFASHGASAHPKIRFIERDAIRHLRSEKGRHDLIVSIPSNLWVAGMENLVSKEFYAAVRERLAPGGVFLQWIPDYNFPVRGLATIARTFESAFGNATLWRLTDYHLAVVFVNDPAPFQGLERIRARTSERPYRASLESLGYREPLLPLALQVASPDMAERLADYGFVQTVHSPVVGRLAMSALLAEETESQSRRFFAEHLPVGKESSNGFFLNRYMREIEPLSDDRLAHAAAVVCGTPPRNFAPCRYLAFSIPPSRRSAAAKAVADELNVRPSHREIEKALRIPDPAMRQTELLKRGQGPARVQSFLNIFQNPIRPFPVSESSGWSR